MCVYLTAKTLKDIDVHSLALHDLRLWERAQIQRKNRKLSDKVSQCIKLKILCEYFVPFFFFFFFGTLYFFHIVGK